MSTTSTTSVSDTAADQTSARLAGPRSLGDTEDALGDQHPTTDSESGASPTDGVGGRNVVGIEGSESSLDALRRGIRIAKALNASIDAIATWEGPTGYGGVGESYSPVHDAEKLIVGSRGHGGPSCANCHAEPNPAQRRTASPTT